MKQNRRLLPGLRFWTFSHPGMGLPNIFFVSRDWTSQREKGGQGGSGVHRIGGPFGDLVAKTQSEWLAICLG